MYIYVYICIYTYIHGHNHGSNPHKLGYHPLNYEEISWDIHLELELHLQVGDQDRITKYWGFDMLKSAVLFHFKQYIFWKFIL